MKNMAYLINHHKRWIHASSLHYKLVTCCNWSLDSNDELSFFLSFFVNTLMREACCSNNSSWDASIVSWVNFSSSCEDLCPICFSYNPSFSACFFSRSSVFLSQQISRNSVSACFFSEVNGAIAQKHRPAECYVSNQLTSLVQEW